MHAKAAFSRPCAKCVPTAIDMTDVCDPRLAPSYRHAEGILIDHRLYHSVAEYVQAGGDLARGMLHKLAQNLHLQPLLARQLLHQARSSPGALGECFEWLHDQFRQRAPQDVFDLVHCMANCNAHVQSRTLQFFSRTLPFVGASRCAVLTNMYCQKQLFGCAYADEVEQVLRALEPSPVTGAE